jgi:ATP-dependent phosphofructokinase / diphosphate-dependent phosphofructokinase
MTKYVGILTAGGDSPGLNAAIRGIGKAAQGEYNMDIVGFKDGFKGLVENKIVPLDGRSLSGILTLGGTILGTSRDKPHKMQIGNKTMDMTDVIVENYHKHHLDVLVCLGGGGTQKNAFRLMEKGLNIITLPKTIDNDVAMTDVTFGYDTALGIATEAIDRLHSTASSHHRILVLEIMGHNAGWLALGAGIAGGADVILLPEIPYDIEIVADAIRKRNRGGKHFSIVALSEGAMPKNIAKELKKAQEDKLKAKNKEEKKKAAKEIASIEKRLTIHTMWVSEQLQKLCKIDSRVTILGHLQRGGTPSAADRLLATRLGTFTAQLIKDEKYGVMVAAKGDSAIAIPLKDVVGKKKLVPINHPWIKSAKLVGTCFGD